MTSKAIAILICLALLSACNREEPSKTGKADPAPAVKVESPANAQIKVVGDFYKAIMAFKEVGVPSREDIAKLSPYISTTFKRDLMSAQAAEEAFAHKTKNQQPPLVGSALFYSSFEGAQRVTGIAADDKGGADAYLVSLEYGVAADKAGFIQWNDRVFLINEEGKWVVNDVELLGVAGSQFGDKGKLSVLLRAVGNEAASKTAPKASSATVPAK